MRRFNQWLGLELGTVHGCLEKLWCIKQHMRAIDCGGKYTRTKWKFNSQEASRSAHKLLRWYTLPSFISPIFAVNIIGLENQTTRINLTFFFPFSFISGKCCRNEARSERERSHFTHTVKRQRSTVFRCDRGGAPQPSSSPLRRPLGRCDVREPSGMWVDRLVLIIVWHPLCLLYSRRSRPLRRIRTNNRSVSKQTNVGVHHSAKTTTFC